MDFAHRKVIMTYYTSKYLSAIMEKVRGLALCALHTEHKGQCNTMPCISQHSKLSILTLINLELNFLQWHCFSNKKYQHLHSFLSTRLSQMPLLNRLYNIQYMFVENHNTIHACSTGRMSRAYSVCICVIINNVINLFASFLQIKNFQLKGNRWRNN